MSHRILCLSGSFGLPSRARALVDLAGARAARRFGAAVECRDLADLQPSLGQARGVEGLTPRARAVVDSLLQADALILGGPVREDSSTGLLRHLFGLIHPAALAGKPILLTAAGDSDRPAEMIEQQLQPLFAFIRAGVLPTGLYAGATDFTSGQPRAPALLARLDRALAQFTPWLGQPRQYAA